MLRTEQLASIIRGLVDGKIPLENAISLIGEDPGLVGYAVSDFILDRDTMRRNRVSDEAAQQILQLLWEVRGTSTCISYDFPTLDSHSVSTFLIARLHENPDQFSDLDLLKCELLGADIAGAVQEVQYSRLNHKATTLRQNPEELSQDVLRVKQHVSAYGFPEELNHLLEKVETGIGSGDSFDQAALLKHLRTFAEQLHKQVSKELQSQKPETKNNTNLASFGQSADFLKHKDVLTEKMYNLAKSLYGVLSDEGVHSATAEREYVRLCRNMVAEYALVLFFELEQRLKA